MPKNLSPITRKILVILANYCKERVESFPDFINEIARVAVNPYYFPEWHTKDFNKYTRDAFRNLERSGYIKRQITGLGVKIALTQRGTIEILRNNINEKAKNKKWDGRWRLIIFDVPEESRYERDFLRKYLKEFGLIELQKSVWIFPYDIEREFLEFLKLCNKKFEGDVRFLTTEYINYDDDFRKKFNLR